MIWLKIKGFSNVVDFQKQSLFALANKIIPSNMVPSLKYFDLSSQKDCPL